MAKNSESKTRKVVKTMFNVRGWSDWDRTKRGVSWIADTFKKIFVVQQPTTVESFPSAMERLNLSDQDIEKRKIFFYRAAVGMFVIALALFGYAMYLLIQMNFATSILSLAVTGIALVLAFRYHFWYYQLKVKKLGCTVQEWFKKGLMGGG